MPTVVAAKSKRSGLYGWMASATVSAISFRGANHFQIVLRHLNRPKTTEGKICPNN
jgi:hypothetical protein